MVASTNRSVSTSTNRSVASYKTHNTPSPNPPDQRKIRRRELMNHVNSIIARTTKLHAHQLQQREMLERALASRKIQTDKTLITAKERAQIQSLPSHKRTGHAPTLGLQSSSRSRSDYNTLNNLTSNTFTCTSLRKWKNVIVTPPST